MEAMEGGGGCESVNINQPRLTIVKGVLPVYLNSLRLYHLNLPTPNSQFQCQFSRIKKSPGNWQHRFIIKTSSHYRSPADHLFLLPVCRAEIMCPNPLISACYNHSAGMMGIRCPAKWPQ